MSKNSIASLPALWVAFFYPFSPSGPSPVSPPVGPISTCESIFSVAQISSSTRREVNELKTFVAEIFSRYQSDLDRGFSESRAEQGLEHSLDQYRTLTTAWLRELAEQSAGTSIHVEGVRLMRELLETHYRAWNDVFHGDLRRLQRFFGLDLEMANQIFQSTVWQRLSSQSQVTAKELISGFDGFTTFREDERIIARAVISGWGLANLLRVDPLLTIFERNNLTSSTKNLLGAALAEYFWLDRYRERVVPSDSHAALAPSAALALAIAEFDPGTSRRNFGKVVYQVKSFPKELTAEELTTLYRPVLDILTVSGELELSWGSYTRLNAALKVLGSDRYTTVLSGNQPEPHEIRLNLKTLKAKFRVVFK